MQRGHLYLDVRLRPEFEAGHPEGAYNLPLQAPVDGRLVDRADFVAAVVAAFAPETRLILGCESGVRSLRAARLLEAAGFFDVCEQRAGMGGDRDAFGRVKERGYRAEGLPLSIGVGNALPVRGSTAPTASGSAGGRSSERCR